MVHGYGLRVESLEQGFSFKFNFVDSCHDSAKLMRAWLCSRCSKSSLWRPSALKMLNVKMLIVNINPQ